MSEFDTPNYAEYAYQVKSEGRIKLYRWLMVLGYIAFVGVFFGICVATKFLPIFATAPIFTWMLVFFTWRYVSYDCYFIFESGRLELGASRNTKNGMKKFPKLTIHVKEAEFIGTYEANKDLIAGRRLYDFSESQASDKRILILFEQNGESSAAVFEGTRKAAKLLQSFCPKCEEIKNIDFHG